MLSGLTAKNCAPEVKTLNYLKKNLLYCFEPQTRSQLKEQIESLEDNFFTATSSAGATSGAERPERPVGGKKTGRKNIGDEVEESEGAEEGDRRKNREKRQPRSPRRERPQEV